MLSRLRGFAVELDPLQKECARYSQSDSEVLWSFPYNSGCFTDILGLISKHHHAQKNLISHLPIGIRYQTVAQLLLSNGWVLR